MKIRIDFSLNDNRKDLLALLKRLQPIWDSAEDIIFDLSDCRYIGPDAVAVLAAAYFQKRRDGLEVKIALPTGPRPLVAFTQFSGLQHLFGLGEIPDVTHPQCVTVPLRQLETARHNDTEPIFQLIECHSDLDEDTKQIIGVALSEVLQNVQDHANSPIGAVTCARFLSGSNEIRIAVVDAGEGILRTLRRTYPLMQDTAEALRSVAAGGYSARSRPNNGGLGISNLCLVTSGKGGALTLVTDGGYLEQRKQRRYAANLDLHFPGTGVFFTIKTTSSERQS